jgi:hypothetical protein
MRIMSDAKHGRGDVKYEQRISVSEMLVGKSKSV